MVRWGERWQVPDYDLTRLGSRAFEQLIVSLGRLELSGAMQVFGDGPDGGREAALDGTIEWTGDSKLFKARATAWSGYTVIQAKFQTKPKPEPRDNALWLQNEISREIAGWVHAAKNRTRERLPDYLIFVTNIDLSPVARTGGIDVLTRFVRNKLEDFDTTRHGLHVKDFAIWHADQVRSMIDAHQEVRWANPGLLTVGDAFSLLGSSQVPIGAMEHRDPLRQELIRSVRLDRHVRLSQSGGPSDGVLWLDDIAIDLPALIDEDPGAAVHAVARILEIGECNLKRHHPDRIKRPSVVVVGGPGQGKSTLSQLIAQAYRTALLGPMTLGPDAREIVAGTEAALARLGLPVPGNRRWPVRVDLAKYAEMLSAGSEKSLLRWISEEIEKRTDQELTPSQLNQWLRSWPWALILDGLDEVPDAAMRRTLYQAIDALLGTADDCDADLLVVITTRPIGYNERFDPARFEHLHLQRLPAADAVGYAKRIVARRFSDDPEMLAKVAERLSDASSDPTTSKLMETPLQVMIMSFIVEKHPNLPPDRFTLFDFYYTTVFDREGAKDIPIAKFLIANRGRVDRLHEQVALNLQVDSETAEGAEASMALHELRGLALGQLRDRGYEADEAEAVARKLETAAMMRLVLLTPRADGVGFEVRSLQEYMAARALAEGADHEALERLALTAHSPHWRNTWLLAAGKLVKSERFEKLLIQLLGAVDTDPHRLAGRFPTGPLLAADILGDNLALNRPGFEGALVARMLSVIDHPAMIGVGSVATGALNAAAKSRYRQKVYDRIAAAASAGVARRAAAANLLFAMRSITRSPGALASIRNTLGKLNLCEIENTAVNQWVQACRTSRTGAGDRTDGLIAVASYMTEAAAAAGYDQQFVEALRRALDELCDTWVERRRAGSVEVCVPTRMYAGNPHLMLALLRDLESACALEDVLASVPACDWTIEAAVGVYLKPALDRLPVGAAVKSHIEDAKAHEADLGQHW